MAGKRQPPLVRPKRSFKTARAAWESLAKQTGLKASQVTPAHTPKAWVWKRKTAASKPAARTGGKPNMAAKKKPTQRRRAATKAKQMVDVESAGIGGLGGALANAGGRMLGGLFGPALGHGVAGAMTKKPATKATAFYIAGASLGGNLASTVPLPEFGAGNGNDEPASSGGFL